MDYPDLTAGSGIKNFEFVVTDCGNNINENIYINKKYPKGLFCNGMILHVIRNIIIHAHFFSKLDAEAVWALDREIGCGSTASVIVDLHFPVQRPRFSGCHKYGWCRLPAGRNGALVKRTHLRSCGCRACRSGLLRDA